MPKLRVHNLAIDWTGWWGPEPPFHHPVFVLTHHAHDPIEMIGDAVHAFEAAEVVSSPETQVTHVRLVRR
jgi:hypothetical protein